MAEHEFVIPENFYFHGDEISQFVYVQVPLAMIREKVFGKISDSAKLLYGLMLNRTGLSIKNGWLDSNNRTYIIYTVENVREDFGVGSTKAKSLFAELSNINGTGVGLIRKERVLNKPSRIYVMNFQKVLQYLTGCETEETFGQVGQTQVETERKTTDLQVGRDYGSRTDADATHGQTQGRLTDRRKCDPRTDVDATYGHPEERPTDRRGNDSRSDAATSTNYQDLSYQDLSKHYPINPGAQQLVDRMEEVRELIKENVDYDALCEDYTDGQIQKLDELIEIMVEACVLEGDVEIKGRRIPHQTIQSRFEKYDAPTMMYVMNSLGENTTEVKNVKKYLLATLFNAPLTRGNQSGLDVQYHLYGRKTE